MSSTATPGYPANPLLAQRSLYRHWERERVRWSDTDMIGHTNNLAFGAYCETGRALFMKHLLGPAAESRQMFLLTQLIVNFIGELHWPAEVAIGTGVMAIGRTSCRLGQGLFDGERCFGTSEALLVLIDEDTRKPRPIPDAVRAWLSEHRLG